MERGEVGSVCLGAGMVCFYALSGGHSMRLERGEAGLPWGLSGMVKDLSMRCRVATAWPGARRGGAVMGSVCLRVGRDGDPIWLGQHLLTRAAGPDGHMDWMGTRV
jgi:hypothetical protein